MAAQPSKKRKRESLKSEDVVDTSKPTAVFKPTTGRTHTLSIALPGSIIANCQTHDQKTSLAAQVARAAAVFCVDEIVIFNDGQSHSVKRRPTPGGRDFQAEDERSGYTGFNNPDDFLYHVLSYLETPPHLRKLLFPMHPNLRTAGAMPSLDMPHHMKANEWCTYREGVTVSPSNNSTRFPSSSSSDASTLVECGLPAYARIPAPIEPNTRVTVRFSSAEEPFMDEQTTLDAEAVAPDAPREEAGYYWGYACRMASSLSAVFTECPYDGGYDLSLGTSERGVSITALTNSGRGRTKEEAKVAPVPGDWSHMLLVFGGVAGLEVAFRADRELLETGVADVKDVFDYWVNLVPEQGSRTIRTEEAVWLGLMATRPIVTDRSG
ncbi:hypothetical protein MBLNU457_6604t1 [Dothideomycetes sp. NU457]